MPAIIELSKKQVVNEALKIVNEKGWDSLNARGLAKNLCVSTKPLYRIFGGMEEIKIEVYKEIYIVYDNYVNENIDNKNPLLSICISYVEFAQQYKNLFVSLFLSNNLKWSSVDEVLDEKWNQATIVNLVNKQGMTFKEAKKLFIDLWLYSNGLATLVATNEMKMSQNEIRERIVEIYKNFAVKK